MGTCQLLQTRDTKMALSRPLLNFARKFSTSSIRSSGAHGDHGTKQWKLGTYLVAVPVVVLATLYNFAMEHEHPHRPEFAKYEYMNSQQGIPMGRWSTLLVPQPR